MLTLELLGALSLRDETRPVPVAAQQKRPLGLLAILGLGGRSGLSRDRIEAYLWPESSGARHSTRSIRRSMRSDMPLAAISYSRQHESSGSIQNWFELTYGSSSKRCAPASGQRRSATIRGRSWTDFILQTATSSSRG